jgi:cell division protein FtsN
MRFQDVKLKNLGTGLMGAGLLGLMLATCGTVVAQEGRDDAKPPQQEEPKQDDAKPAQPKAEPKDAKPSRDQEQPKADEAKPSKNEKQEEKQNEKQNSEMKPGKDQNHPVQNNNERPMQNNDRAMQNNGGDHAQAGNQRGQRIPDDKFRSNFGRQHTFRVQTQVVEGQPRFQYGGYWFALANPWPGDWAYSDDCYVDYINGEYVLIDLRHPGVQLVLMVVE